jgi:hypothetical protein
MATLDLLFDGKSFPVTKKSCSELVEQHQDGFQCRNNRHRCAAVVALAEMSRRLLYAEKRAYSLFRGCSEYGGSSCPGRSSKSVRDKVQTKFRAELADR